MVPQIEGEMKRGGGDDGGLFQSGQVEVGGLYHTFGVSFLWSALSIPTLGALSMD